MPCFAFDPDCLFKTIVRGAVAVPLTDLQMWYPILTLLTEHGTPCNYHCHDSGMIATPATPSSLFVLCTFRCVCQLPSHRSSIDMDLQRFILLVLLSLVLAVMLRTLSSTHHGGAAAANSHSACGVNRYGNRHCSYADGSYEYFNRDGSYYFHDTDGSSWYDPYEEE